MLLWNCNELSRNCILVCVYILPNTACLYLGFSFKFYYFFSTCSCTVRKESENESVSPSVLSSFLQSRELQLFGLLCPWSSAGKNIGVGSHFLLQGIFLTQRSNPDLPHCRQILYWLSHQGEHSIQVWQKSIFGVVFVIFWLEFIFRKTLF